MKAIDVCFKAIHSLNATYPIEAEQVWLLIQKCIYKIDTAYDKPHISLENILKEITR